jgi:hypothetical protein
MGMCLAMFRMPLPGEGPARAEISPEAAQAVHEPQQGGGGCFVVETPCEAAESQAAAPPQKPPSKKQRTASNPQAQSASAPLGGDVFSDVGAAPAAVPTAAAGPVGWECAGCTYVHEGLERDFLACALCGRQKSGFSEGRGGGGGGDGWVHGGGSGGRGQSPLPRLWKALEA